MLKEMIVVSSSHETKIAMLEDEQVAEVYFERQKEHSLAGSIYKGRVMRVLPGMQSAFVNVGLERDAFLYVSDFFEDTEEYDTVATTVAEEPIARPVARQEDKEDKVEEQSRGVPSQGVFSSDESGAASGAGSGENTPQPSVAAPVGAPVAAPVAEREAASSNASGSAEESSARSAPSEEAAQAKAPYSGGRSRHFSRRSRRRRPRNKGFPDSKYASRSDSAPPAADSPSAPTPTILPGESLAKYKGVEAAPGLPPIEQSSGGPAETLAAQEERPEAPAAAKQLLPTGFVAELQAKVQEQFSPPQAPVDIQPVEEALEEERMADETPAPETRVEEEPVRTASDEAKQLAEQRLSAEPDGVEEPQTESIASQDEVISAESTVAEPAVAEFAAPETSEEGEQLPVAPRSEEGEGSEEVEGGEQEAQMPQQATVREGHRNPRYQRRSRWGGRREGRGGADYRGGRAKEREAPKPLIADLLKEGQEIIVQIAKEPLGRKGARITSHIALPGRYLVFMPTVNHVGISRKISSEQERQRLKRIILSNNLNIAGGFIARTAAEGRSEEDLRQDILFLSNLWTEIKLQAEKAPAPALLHHDWNLVLRTLRDHLSEEFSTIWVDNEQEYERIVNLVSKFQPALVNRVKLYTKEVPLFEELGIQEEINKALKPKVWLKSGGYIVINQTEALVAIDVNTGKFVGKSNRLEDTIVKTNVEAIQEIVRQIRLRDLGGIIVIDFIDMDERKNRQKVMTALEDALRADKAPSKVLPFNEFGLVAITRKRVRQSLERTLCQPCPYCNNSGLVKSPATVCNEILIEAKKLAAHLDRKQVTLRVNPEVAKALKERGNAILQEIEELTHKDIIVRNDPSLHIESFDFH
ncbi:MAG: Rne/Rng family ribonuclease [Acidobacteria bacterium]|nr:Rne/Rng family ribonuclease [Acidobacteriota bacterium]